MESLIEAMSPPASSFFSLRSPYLSGPGTHAEEERIICHHLG
jgi:hypothetical protein